MAPTGTGVVAPPRGPGWGQVWTPGLPLLEPGVSGLQNCRGGEWGAQHVSISALESAAFSSPGSAARPPRAQPQSHVGGQGDLPAPPAPTPAHPL